MAEETLRIDDNHRNVAGGVTNDASQEIRNLRVDPVTNALITSADSIGSASATQYLEDSGDPLIYYLGLAEPGTGTGAASWQIRRITYSASTDDVIVQWADGDALYDNIYSDRESLSYS